MKRGGEGLARAIVIPSTAQRSRGLPSRNGSTNFRGIGLRALLRMTNGLRPKRLFVSLELPASVTDSLVRLNPHLRGVRWLEPEQMHLTLGFFGDVAADAEEKLRSKLASIEFHAFFLPITGLGTFPAKGPPKIIWAGVGAGHPHLFQLHKRVQDAALAAGLEAELRPWHPHITLARCRDVSAEFVRPFLRAHQDFDAGMIRIESFELKSSRLTPSGSIYTTEMAVAARS